MIFGEVESYGVRTVHINRDVISESTIILSKSVSVIYGLLGESLDIIISLNLGCRCLVVQFCVCLIIENIQTATIQVKCIWQRKKGKNQYCEYQGIHLGDVKKLVIVQIIKLAPF